MQRVLSSDLWSVIHKQSRRAKRRMAAIAYVTKDLIGLKKGDVLITDASPQTIKAGGTDAKLLRRLINGRVRVYNCPTLHAKVILLDGVAVVGSANMSQSSGGLVEAAVMTDHNAVVSAAESFLKQLSEASAELDPRSVARLCRIKVVRRGGRGVGRAGKRVAIAPLGHRTWLVGVQGLVRDPSDIERELIGRAEERLRGQGIDVDHVSWLKLGRRGNLPQRCQEGDTLIMIWRDHGKTKPSAVRRPKPILLKQRAQHWTRLYHGAGARRPSEMSWARFQRLLRRIGFTERVGRGSARLLEPDVADAISRAWASSAKA